MTNTKFPLVSDNEVILSEVPYMNLYDETDFISNIKGDYQDKNYSEERTPSVATMPHGDFSQAEKRKQALASKLSRSFGSESPEKSYAELAREEARADLKKKRSASYLTSDVVPKKHRSTLGVSPRKSTTTKVQPTAFFQKENSGEFAKYAQHLKQEDYIVVDWPTNDTVPEEAPVVEKKNNYDFLKTSQVYNNQEIQEKKEHTVATELNLTHFDQV